MNGIILKTDGNYAVVLTQSGDYKKIKMMDDQIFGKGDEIQLPSGNLLHLPKPKISPALMRYSVALLLLVFIALPIKVFYDTYQVAGYVNIDINPSVQFSYNKDFEVIKIIPLNTDATNLLEKGDLKKESVHETVESFIRLAKEFGYITNEKDIGIIISLTMLDDELDLEQLYQNVNAATSDISSIQVEYYISNEDTFNRAKNINQSPGMMIMKEELSCSDAQKTNQNQISSQMDTTIQSQNKVQTKEGTTADDIIRSQETDRVESENQIQAGTQNQTVMNGNGNQEVENYQEIKAELNEISTYELIKRYKEMNKGVDSSNPNLNIQQDKPQDAGNNPIDSNADSNASELTDPKQSTDTPENAEPSETLQPEIPGGTGISNPKNDENGIKNDDNESGSDKESGSTSGKGQK